MIDTRFQFLFLVDRIVIELVRVGLCLFLLDFLVRTIDRSEDSVAVLFRDVGFKIVPQTFTFRDEKGFSGSVKVKSVPEKSQISSVDNFLGAG